MHNPHGEARDHLPFMGWLVGRFVGRLMGKPMGRRIGFGRSVKRADGARSGYTSAHPTTFSECVREFLKRQERPLTRATQERNEFRIARLLEFFGREAKVESISHADVQRFIVCRSKKAEASSIVDEIRLLRRVLRVGVESGVLESNAAEGIKPPRRIPAKASTLTETEFKKVIEALPRHLKMMAIISVACGLSTAELRKLTWKCIETQEEKMTLKVTKGRDVRRISLNAAALRALADIRSENPNMSGRIFKGKQSSTINISQGFRRVAVKSIGRQVTFRDLRFTAASFLAQNISLETAAAYMGHKTLRMAERLQRREEQPPSEGMSAIDRFFDLTNYQF